MKQKLKMYRSLLIAIIVIIFAIILYYFGYFYIATIILAIYVAFKEYLNIDRELNNNKFNSLTDKIKANINDNISNMSYPIALIDNEGNILWANKRLKEEIAHYELKDLVLSAKLVNDISIIDKIYNDKDTKYISKLANKITEEDNKIVLFALINGDRVNLVFSCSKNLNSLDMNSLLKDAIKLIDGNGGGNKFNAQGGGKNNSNLESLINYTLMKLQNELD